MNRMMMFMMPLMSVWISFQVPAGVGIYWVLSNALALLQTFVLGKLYNPREMAAKAKAGSRKSTSKLFNRIATLNVLKTANEAKIMLTIKTRRSSRSAANMA